MASGGSARLIGSGLNPFPEDGYGSPEDTISFEGIVASAVGGDTLTLTLTEDIPSSTPTEAIVLVMAATLWLDDTSAGVSTATISDDSSTSPGCYSSVCYPGWYHADMEAANAFGSIYQGLPSLYYLLVTRPYPSGTTFTTTFDAGDLFSSEGFLAVFTRGKAEPRDLPYPNDTPWSAGADKFLNGNFYGARYQGKGGNGEDGDDCIGGLVSLSMPWNSGDNGPFGIASDIGLIISCTHAAGHTNPDSLLFFYSAYRQPFDQGWPTWDFTELAQHDSGAVYENVQLPSGSFFYDDRMAWGYRIVGGGGSVSFDTQWACPGHFTTGGITLYRDVGALYQWVATMARGNGVPCCKKTPRGVIIADNFKVEN